MTLRRALQPRPQNPPGRTQRNRLDPAHPLPYPSPGQGAHQRPQVIHAHDAALQQTIRDDGRVGRSVNRLDVSDAHQFDVIFRIVDAAHHALVVAEEEDGEPGYKVDGDEEGALLQGVRYVP